jgi:hypothetical protein
VVFVAYLNVPWISKRDHVVANTEFLLIFAFSSTSELHHIYASTLEACLSVMEMLIQTAREPDEARKYSACVDLSPDLINQN